MLLINAGMVNSSIHERYGRQGIEKICLTFPLLFFPLCFAFVNFVPLPRRPSDQEFFVMCIRLMSLRFYF